MIEVIDVSLLAFLVVLAVTVARLRNLFAVVMVTGFYSLVTCALYTVLDAVDVAFTEAAVGAGVSTMILLATLLLTTEREASPARFRALPLAVALGTGAILLLGTRDMPLYGDPRAPINLHVAPRYIAGTLPETGVPNVVTSTLASYRGYDTLGETTVIFTAGLGVLLLIGQALRFRPRQGAVAGGDRT